MIAARRITFMVVGLIIVAAGLTLVFLSMRAVMDIGGTCASGGPYVVAQECPDGAAAMLPLGIIGGLAGLFLYYAGSSKLPGPHLTLLAWSALFLSLGWNFWEYGLNPPGDLDGVVWGWIICGVVFVVMGAFPLVGLFDHRIAKQMFWADAPPDGPVDPQPLRDHIVPRQAAAAPAPTQPAPDDSLPAALERLAALHAKGALTDEEFAAAKRHLLEQQ